jgi:HEAT repeat protein
MGPAAVPSLTQALRSKDYHVRTGAARALGWMGTAAKEAIPALVQALRDGG